MPENEGLSPHPEEGGERSPEFDEAQYPEKVGCKTLPSLDGRTVMAEIDDVWGDTNSVDGIPVVAITRLNMPQLGPNIPGEVRDIFEQGIGLSMLSCRQEEIDGEDAEDLESPIKIYVPTISGDVELMVRRRTLVRKR